MLEQTTPAAPPPKTHRHLGDWVVHAPQRLRAWVRADEIWLAILSAVVGVLGGASVALIELATEAMHTRLFALPTGQGLSESAAVAPLRAFFVPLLGGAVLGVSLWALAKLRPRPLVDPVEANALYGGRVSLNDSIIVALQTTWSNGVGASVGMEAGFAQIGAGIASRLGRSFRLRRNDLRVLVGAGAAAAIGGAFNAPLCGAFYGIELIIGIYSITTLPFVVIAALAGTLTTQLLLGGTPPLSVALPLDVPGSAYPMVVVLGVLSGLAGIAIMRGVTAIEAGFRRSGIPLWARPVLGGAVVGVLGCITPKALSSGHSALHADIGVTFPFFVLLLFFVLKAVASAFSIGSGFRGGLFFASLFLGALFGKLFAGLMLLTPLVTPMPVGFYAVVGMSALATAIVGGPMTMTFLALESTQNFAVTMAVLAAAIVSTITVRRLFGYSFATWRFHLRGETIRSAVDIGWINNLTVGRMMRPVQAIVQQDMALGAFMREYPLGAVQRVIVTDAEDKYAGIVYPAEAFGLGTADGVVADILHHAEHFLLPGMTVKEAIAAFETAEADALPVLDSTANRNVTGLLTEQYALRRYNEELDRRRREISGEG
ncbi:MAG: chloride channel protein [Acidocella sp. 20-57-95]|nr:MAG: chloride channel protein [Acidocella sp. 20-57-95]OYV59304.1 MAG: chloride channel protein [Acidocella sp. 21-58-7]HQT62995.1 chloride channel protein [Acidocella sp.]HQU03176.1 chloride channel protein [Acidocella sp.]